MNIYEKHKRCCNNYTYLYDPAPAKFFYVFNTHTKRIPSFNHGQNYVPSPNPIHNLKVKSNPSS